MKYHKQTPATVRTIRRLDRAGVPQPTMARVFNTCQSNISYIVRRHTWKHEAIR